MTNMLYMPKNTATKQLGGDIPEGLVDEFDELVDRLGLTKKRAIAAAIFAFTNAGKVQQFEAYQDVYEKFYATPRDARAAAQDAAVDEILEEDLKGKSKTRRGA